MSILGISNFGRAETPALAALAALEATLFAVDFAVDVKDVDAVTVSFLGALDLGVLFFAVVVVAFFFAGFFCAALFVGSLLFDCVLSLMMRPYFLQHPVLRNVRCCWFVQQRRSPPGKRRRSAATWSAAVR